MKELVMNKYVKLLVEAMMAGAALFLAFQIRFEGNVPAADQTRMWRMLLPVIAARLITVLLFGMWNQKWRFTTADDALRLALTHCTPTLALFILRKSLGDEHWFVLPLGVIAIDFLLALTAALGVRLFWRRICEHRRGVRSTDRPRRLLLVGAGYHGAMIANELSRNRGVTVLGFLDDDPNKRGATISGRKVFGATNMLEEYVKEHNVDDVLVCIPPAERSGFKLKPLNNGAAARVTLMPTVDDVLQSDWASVQPVRRTAAPHRRSSAMRKLEAPSRTPVSNRRILITGGAGFIGSSLASRLAQNNELVLFDLTFKDKPIGFTDLGGRSNVKLVEGDILDERLLTQICADVDVVIHTAAVLGVSRVCSAARDTLETNYVGTSRLLHALEANKHLERLIYFSTSEVFGINSYRVTEDTPSSIGSSTEARWSYAIAKVAGEHLVRSYYRDDGTPAVIVRPFNVFGPRRTGDYALLRFILNAVWGAPLVVHGDGSQIRAWCYIEDFCDAILAMIERPEAVGEDFNIGNPGNTITVYELARRVIELTGSSSPVAFVDNPFPDISIRVPCLTKARQILGYEPRVDLDTGLSQTIDWYRKHWENFRDMVNAKVEVKVVGAA
jgi:nucleoside-diphosphate-sugar epimerase